MEQNELVCIAPMNAVLLRNTSNLTKMAPYCVLSIGAVRCKTRISNILGGSPRWEDEFTFITSPGAVLDVEIWDNRLLSSDKLIGKGSVVLPVCQGTEMQVDLFHNEIKAGEIRVLCKAAMHRGILGPSSINNMRV